MKKVMRKKLIAILLVISLILPIASETVIAVETNEIVNNTTENKSVQNTTVKNESNTSNTNSSTNTSNEVKKMKQKTLIQVKLKTK